MFKNRYCITADSAISKVTGNEGCILMGWSLGLPEQAHELILSSTSEEIKKENKFFLQYERHLPTDKLLADLRFSKSIGVIPLYFDTLPISERVFTISTISVSIPTLVDDRFLNEVRKIKQNIVKLNSINKTDAHEHLSNIKYAFEDLLAVCTNKEVIKAKIFCLEFPSGVATDIFFAFVIVDFNTEIKKNAT